MCSTSQDMTCYSYVITKFNFSSNHNVLTPSVALPVALLTTTISSGLYCSTPTYSICQRLSCPHVALTVQTKQSNSE